MAVSPAHKFGQIIGEALQRAVEPHLNRFARNHQLYFDKKGRRKARKGLSVSWTDKYGNKHDLDFVLEKYGTAHKIGLPVAFIEVAWRRYTKHSRNKVQEIQGAIAPLVETYKDSAPFKGVVLAGVFTNGALEQLRSQGFQVLYFPYEIVIKAFSKVGIDAYYNENTPDAIFEQKVSKWDALSPKERKLIEKTLVQSKNNDLTSFMEALDVTVSRQIKTIIIVPLYGNKYSLSTIEQAVRFLKEYKEETIGDIYCFEIIILYNNGNRVEGRFNDSESAIDFLNKYQLSSANSI